MRPPTPGGGAAPDAGAHGGQWPRWEVFKQEEPDRPHQAVGSVHAADAEHALLMARSVFARRPSGASLWVVRAEAILAVTAEQLELEPGVLDDGAASGAGVRAFEVFRKAGHRRSMTFVDHVGTLQAPSARAALRLALARDDGAGLAWWVVAADDLAASPVDESDAWFGPADDKRYKQQSAYGTVAPRAKRGGGAA